MTSFGPLARTSVPALLLAGDRDPLLPAIQHTATHIPGGTLIQLPDCGHLDTFVRSDLTLRSSCRSCPGTVLDKSTPDGVREDLGQVLT